MKLYLMRHGQSPSAHEAGVKHDFDRPLSEGGRQDVRRAAEHLLREGARPALILSSPIKRALESAREASSVFRPALEVREYDPLSNQLSGQELFARILKEQNGSPELLLVGHQPQLGELAFRMTGTMLDMQPGGLVALETDGKSNSLLWSLNPDEL